MSLTYGVESFFAIKEELPPLLEQHWKEIATDQSIIPLDPDWEAYATMYRNRIAEFVTVRDGSRLVGYSVWLVKQHPHYKSTLYGYNDIIYLDPEYRRGSAGINLIKASEAHMRNLGVKKLIWHIKVTNDWRPILVRLGYSLEEYNMGKVI